jgi:general secretion pathway protein B
MSYILDALKKAELERKLGSIPDMHAQPFATASAAGASARRRLYAWGALAGVVLIAGAIAWFAPWQTAPRPDTGATLSPQVSSGAVSVDTDRNVAQTSSPAITEPVPSPIAQAAAPEKTPAPMPQETAQPKPAKPKPTPAPIKKKKAEQVPAATAATATSPPATEQKKESTEPALASAVEPRLPGLRDLPDNIQREIPVLTIGGYIYSSIAAERSVLINNRLLREGSEISHGLVLEKMLPKGAVLNYKGYRYRIPY